MNRVMGKLVIISAPSGAGKTSLVNHLLSQRNDIEFSVSAATRKPRYGEKDGKDYYFMQVEEFRKKISEGEFVEWEEVYSDHYYGTLRSELERIWSKGSHVLFDVDVKGGINLKNIFGNRALSVFIMPPSVEELRARLVKRGTDDPARIETRVSKAVAEMELSGSFDSIIINRILEEAEKEILELVSGFLDN